MHRSPCFQGSNDLFSQVKVLGLTHLKSIFVIKHLHYKEAVGSREPTPRPSPSQEGKN
ncbi:MAG: hypothetical protein F6K48_16045 [Okeania sp. SIO3H1]|nr:hypothetical protein [Okeania sp. SIO3H1]